MQNGHTNDTPDDVIPIADVVQGVAKPLTVILGQAQLLIRRIEQDRPGTPEDQLRALRSIEQSADRIRWQLAEMANPGRKGREG